MPINTQPRHIKNGEDYSGYNFVTPKVVDDTKDCTTTFTSSDDSTTTDKTSDGMTSVVTLSSGETRASLFEKISKMFLNIRKLWNTVGTTDISSIGQTVTGAINNLGSIDVLWTNTSPLENFVSQTISINTLNSYKAICIIAEAAVNLQFYSTIYIYKDFGDGLDYLIHCPHVDVQTGLAYTGVIRECVVYWSTNQIHFGQGKYGSSNNRNDTGIPVMILGIGK